MESPNKTTLGQMIDVNLDMMKPRQIPKERKEKRQIL